MAPTMPGVPPPKETMKSRSPEPPERVTRVAYHLPSVGRPFGPSSR